MRIEKNLNLLWLTYYHLKSLRFLYWVPLAVLFLLLPVLSIEHVHSTGMSETTFLKTFMELQRYVPFMATWWILFGLREYAEGNGKELLYVYKPSLLPDFFFIFIWYALHAAVLFALYGIFLENYWMDYLLMMIQSLVFASATFFLMLLCRTIAVPFLINVLYEIFCIYSNMNTLTYINMLSVNRIEQIEDLRLPYLPLFVFAIFLIGGANFFYRKRGVL